MVEQLKGFPQNTENVISPLYINESMDKDNEKLDTMMNVIKDLHQREMTKNTLIDSL